MTKKIKKIKSNRTLLSAFLMIFVSLFCLTGCSLLAKKDTNIDHTEIGETNQKDDVIPNESDQDQVTSESDSQAQKVYFGEWVINQVQAYGVGTYSSEDAESLFGKTLSFTEDEASYFGDQPSDIEKVAKNPIYTEKIVSESDFVTNFRIPFDNLGIGASSITEVNVSNSNGNVSNFFIKDDDTLIIYGGGTYFELIRKDSNETQNNDIDMKETQDVDGYVKSIDTKKKTITIDQVELVYSDDEERLTELGIKSDDLTLDFYTYNEDKKLKSMTYNDNLSIELLNGTLLSESGVEELEELLSQHEILCKLVLKDNVVIKISEIYLP